MGALRSAATRLAVLMFLLGALFSKGAAVDHNVSAQSSPGEVFNTFSPADLTIAAGDRVIWTATSGIHNVTCDPSASPPTTCWIASGTLGVGGQFIRPNPTENPGFTFGAQGTYTYNCTLHPGMTGTVTVGPGPLHHYLVTAPAEATAGSGFSVVVNAQGQSNNNITNISRTVRIDSNDPNDTMPANITLSAGTGTFNGVILRTAGTRIITVTDVATPSITGTDTLMVKGAAASQVVLTAPASASPGVSLQVTVTARDQFNNVASDYTGKVQFTSSDLAATLPNCSAAADCALTNSVRNFNVIFATEAAQTLTVTDKANATLTDTAALTISPACSTRFSNTAAIAVPVSGAATPYPSTIVVAGLNQAVNGMSLTLNGLSHTAPGDVDILLLGPGGQKMIVMSDAGSSIAATGLTFTVTDAGAGVLPAGAALTEGTFKPTNHGAGDTFATPAPIGPYSSPGPAGTATLASVFNGTDPNGSWSLYVVDDAGNNAGSISGGWTLTFAPAANTFCNQSNITIPDFARAIPYPSTINVSGLNGTISNLSVRLDRPTGVFTPPGDLDMLLVGPGAQKKMIILSDAGGASMLPNAIVTLDDSGAAVPTPLTGGVFVPTNIGAGDPFSGAPAGPYADPAVGATFASTFAGINPNGNWSLYIVEDSDNPILVTTANITNGWALSFDVVFNTTTEVAANISPSIWGQSVTFTATLESSGGVPTGTVQFKDGTTALSTPRGLSGGTAQLQWAALTPGMHNITAEYSGDSNFHPSTSSIVVHTVVPAPTATTVITSPNPSTFGDTVSFTATVTESAPNAPDGTVTLRADGVEINTLPLPLPGLPRQVTFSTKGLDAGNRAITAVYNGDSLFAGSTSPPVAQLVNKAATSTSLTSAPPTSAYGTPVTFTATVAEGTPGTPTGFVTFKNGAAVLGTGIVDASRQAILSTANLTVGGHSITAEYGGDNNFLSDASLPVIQIVTKGTPSITLIPLQGSINFGEQAAFRAIVTGPGAVAPDGTVTFKDGAATLGTIALSSGTAQISTSSLAGGNRNITAVYNGDGNYNTQTSSILVQEVIAAETATALGSSLNPSAFGQPVTFTATVISGVGTPAGTVTFMDGATPLGTPAALNGLGIATLTTPSLTAGTHSITAIYNSNGSFATSTSASVTQNVSQSATTVVVTALKETSVFRQSITFTVAVDSTTSGTPTGTVTFFDGTTELGSASLNGVGEAAITISRLPVGRHQITVQYAGDSNFPPNTSLVLIHYRSPKPR
jgi:plastocyanin